MSNSSEWVKIWKRGEDLAISLIKEGLILEDTIGILDGAKETLESVAGKIKLDDLNWMRWMDYQGKNNKDE